jgi:hypothetical protein
MPVPVLNIGERVLTAIGMRGIWTAFVLASHWQEPHGGPLVQQKIPPENFRYNHFELAFPGLDRPGLW